MSQKWQKMHCGKLRNHLPRPKIECSLFSSTFHVELPVSRYDRWKLKFLCKRFSHCIFASVQLNWVLKYMEPNSSAIAWQNALICYDIMLEVIKSWRKPIPGTRCVRRYHGSWWRISFWSSFGISKDILVLTDAGICSKGCLQRFRLKPFVQDLKGGILETTTVILLIIVITITA